jgi:hypothetical protein
MRRLTFIAAFVLFLTVPLFAQRGGGGHGGGGGHAGGFGGHGGGFGGHASFSGGGHASGGFGGMRSGSMHSSRGGFTHTPFHSGASGVHFNTFRGHRGRFVNNFGFRNNFGFGRRGRFGFPWGYGGYYDPYWWDSDYDNSYDQDYEYDRGVAQQMNEDSLEQQRMWRQEEADGDRDAYARPDPAPVREAQGAPIMPATVLVFRDQHRQEVQNYAIVGQTLWNFAPQHTQKIPLADLDLAATAKANDENGVTFRAPNVNEGQ